MQSKKSVKEERDRIVAVATSAATQLREIARSSEQILGAATTLPKPARDLIADVGSRVETIAATIQQELDRPSPHGGYLLGLLSAGAIAVGLLADVPAAAETAESVAHAVEPALEQIVVLSRDLVQGLGRFVLEFDLDHLILPASVLGAAAASSSIGATIASDDASGAGSGDGSGDGSGRGSGAGDGAGTGDGSGRAGGIGTSPLGTRRIGT